jgi:hypothetical protein
MMESASPLGQEDTPSKPAPKLALTAFRQLSAEQFQATQAWANTEPTALPSAEILDVLRTVLAFAQPLAPLLAKNKRLKELLHRAMRIVPTSEKKNAPARLGVDEPKASRQKPETEEERLLQRLADYDRKAKWHDGMAKKRKEQKKAARKALRKLRKRNAVAKPAGGRVVDDDDEQDDDDEPTPEWVAKKAAHSDRAGLGGGADRAFDPPAEALMNAMSVATVHKTMSCNVDRESLRPGTRIQRAFTETRRRIDASFCVTLLNVEQEYLSVVDTHGDKQLIAGDILDIGPARADVTWRFLSFMSIMLAQQVCPMNRLARMVTTPDRKFTSTDISRYFPFVAEFFVPVYLHMAKQLADAPILCGDDTEAKVLEVDAAFAKVDANPAMPWDAYATADKAQETCLADGDAAEFSAKLAAKLGFRAQRKNKDGNKVQLNVSVLSGRSVASDPASIIVFYRTHLGSLGNLLDKILPMRRAGNKGVVIQSDLSTTNLISDKDWCDRFDVRFAGCYPHARRPFIAHEADDPALCEMMQTFFQGIPIYEGLINAHGRNAINTVAVRDFDQRDDWESIRDCADLMLEIHPKTTPLGKAANYIIKNYDKLTYYLKDARVAPDNNFSERMLRMENLIQKNALFRKTLKGRFALDVMRTIIQTCQAAGAIPSEYIEWMMRQPKSAVADDPDAFTPYRFSEWQNSSGVQEEDGRPAPA